MSETNFWDHHGVFFLIFITMFPRLTLLFSSVTFGGFFWWLGFIFASRFLVAILATLTYIKTNPILVIISWFVAFSGESGEKFYIRKHARRSTPTQTRRSSLDDGNTIDVDHQKID